MTKKFSLNSFSYKTLLTIIVFLLIGIVALIKITSKPKDSVEASWWNETWRFRRSIDIANTGGQQSNVYLVLSLDTSDLSKFKATAGDIRFITFTGQFLDYYLASGIGTSNTQIQVNFTTLEVGSQTIFVYYGNPSAPDGFSSSPFSTLASSSTPTLSPTEELSPGPIAHWKFNEGVGNTAYNSNGSNHGIISGAAWQSEDQCLSGKCLRFNDSHQYLKVSDANRLNMGNNSFTISSWINPNNNAFGAILGQKRQNLIKYSQDHNSWPKYCGGGTVEVDTHDTPAPDGTYTAEKMTAVNTGGCGDVYSGYLQTDDGLPTGKTYTASIWLKGAVGGERMTLGLADGYYRSDIYLTTNWQRYTYTRTMSTASNRRMQFTVFNADPQPTFYSWGAQVEVGSTTSPYVQSTSSHLDYDGVTLWLENNILKSIIGDESVSVIATGPTLEQNKWQHIAVSYDRSNNLTFFLNGISVGSTTLSSLSGLTLSGAIDLFLGSTSETDNYNTFNGLLDEVKVYPYARTPQQILADYNDGLSGISSSQGSSAVLGSPLNTQLTPPIAHYKFDEGYGTTANNSGSAGSSANGTFGAGTSIPSWFSSGKVGKALSFTSSQADRLNTSLVYNNSSEYTISAYIYPTHSSINDYRIIAGSIKGNNIDAGMVIASNNRICYHDYVSKGDTNYCSANDQITLNTWQHVALSFKANDVKVFHDGKLVTTVGVGKTNTSANLIIGGPSADSYSGARYFDGFIDEVKIYNYALSPEEVKLDYNQGSAFIMGSTSQNIGGTTTSLEYCLPGDTSYCAPPIAEWNFEENTDTIAKDTSGNDNNSTFGTGNSAPSWATGKIGAGLNFDGINDYNETIQSTTLPNDISISMWIYPTSWTHQTHTSLISSRTGTNGLMFFILSQGNLNFDWGSGQNRWDTGYQPPLNKWTYLTLTRNSSLRTLYVNGKYQNSTAVTGTSSANSTNIRIGNDNSSGTYQYFFSGKIDQVKIYNYTRTPAQIAWDYNRGAPFAHWKMDECQGTTIHDSSGNNYHGTLNVGVGGTQVSVGTCDIPATAWGNSKSGKLNSGLSFDGADDYATATIPNFINQNAGSWAISSWIKRTGNIGCASQVIGKMGWHAGLMGSNCSTNFRCSLVNASNSYFVVDSPALTQNKWYHAVCQYDANTNLISLFIDGQSVGSTTFSGTIRDFNDTVYFGGNSVPQPSSVVLDEIKFYRYPLTSEQIKIIYNNGAVSFN